MKKEKVSFDFDDTLTESDVQGYVKELIDIGFDVYIVTSRVDNKYAKEKNWWWVKNNNQQLFDIAEKLGISKDKIIFTQYQDKIEYLKGKNFIFHLDDDDYEIEQIQNSDDECVGILKEKDWNIKCRNYI